MKIPAHKIKLNCSECNALIIIDKAKIAWSGKIRKCKTCSVKKMSQFNY